MADLSMVSRIEEIDPDDIEDGLSGDVNNWLEEGWILLETGVHARQSDAGPTRTVYYAIGWAHDSPPPYPDANSVSMSDLEAGHRLHLAHQARQS